MFNLKKKKNLGIIPTPLSAGRIDHAHHHNNGRRALEEIGALDEAVRNALNITQPSETLLVLTADHSHVFTFGGDNTPRGHPVMGIYFSLTDVFSLPLVSSPCPL